MFEDAPVRDKHKKHQQKPSDNILPTPQPKHPYLSGNFAPIHETLPLTPCTYEGRIPNELAGGEYVRNGSNPLSNDDLGRDAHWFDGDGMLSGVSFRTDEKSGRIEPEFVNQFVLTDVYLSTLASPRLRHPILPSIATLVNPLTSMFYIALRILRTILLVILSHLPGSELPIKKMSVANTNVVYHDGRALATCESGPPMRIQLPGLETVGWYNGAVAEGEPNKKEMDEKARKHEEKILGQDAGLLSFIREWTTAHPKVDPKTKEMIMFHSSFAPPYVQYSIIPQAPTQDTEKAGRKLEKMVNAPVPGIHGAKMMHDFGVSLAHTVIMDLPLTLDPVNQMIKGLPPVTYDSAKPSRFGVFPRRFPEQVQWFETDASCIFHTANTWDDVDVMGHPTAVNMLCCRLTAATLIFASGNIAPPVETRKKTVTTSKRMPFFSKYTSDPTATNPYERSALLESPTDDDDDLTPEEIEALRLFNEDQCRLYYYHFSLATGNITHQWALTALPFEFPSVRPNLEMQAARYIYGCSTTSTSFGSGLGKAAKIDALVKVDSTRLIARGQRNPPRSVIGIVDRRSMDQVLASEDADDPIQVFRLPDGWYAQEPRFVPSSSFPSDDDNNAAEDAGHLLFYAFNETQLEPTTGSVPDDSDPVARATSELWIVNARNMRDVVARVQLPLRVPYGLHGAWFGAEDIRGQRPVESLRGAEEVREARRRRDRAVGEGRQGWGLWARDVVESWLA